MTFNHYDPSRNNGIPLDLQKRDSPIVLHCELCDYDWISSTRAYILTPKCQNCSKRANSVGVLYPEILGYSTSNKIYTLTPRSDEKIEAKCPTCGTWFERSIASFVSFFKTNEDPCGACAPRHRERNGILFFKNNPELRDMLLSDIGDRKDFSLSTKEKFLWLKRCGHSVEQTPLKYLAQPEKCLSCLYPGKKLKQLTCSKCSTLQDLSKHEISKWKDTKSEFICVSCSREKKIALNSLESKITTWEFVGFSRKNDHTLESISSSSAKRVLWECKEKAHEFERFAYASIDSCPRCNGSSVEDVVSEMLKDYKGEIVRNDRSLISPYELDFFFPERNLAIEVNGIYWHSRDNVPKERHRKKFLLCKEKGVQLITLWEDDINNKAPIVESLLKTKLSISKANKINARSCKLKVITPEESRIFLTARHIQGFSRGSTHLGLLHNDTLVAVMTLLKNGKELLINRYATSENVRGGFSKMLAFASSLYRGKCDVITSFSSNEISWGALYESNGFKSVKYLPEDYSYVTKKKVREHKFNYRLSRFKNDSTLLFEEGKSERELAVINGFGRAWDCGKIKWAKQLQ